MKFPMKRLLLPGLLLVLAACASMTIPDTDFGLLKGDVFSAQTPAAFDFEEGKAGRERIEPLAGSGMPPMVSHAVAEYLPITVSSNPCLTCHKPAAHGQAPTKGQPTPAPASHLAKGGDGKVAVAGANYNCTACHAPQAGVQPLITNTAR